MKNLKRLLNTIASTAASINVSMEKSAEENAFKAASTIRNVMENKGFRHYEISVNEPGVASVQTGETEFHHFHFETPFTEDELSRAFEAFAIVQHVNKTTQEADQDSEEEIQAFLDALTAALNTEPTELDIDGLGDDVRVLKLNLPGDADNIDEIKEMVNSIMKQFGAINIDEVKKTPKDWWQSAKTAASNAQERVFSTENQRNIAAKIDEIIKSLRK